MPIYEYACEECGESFEELYLPGAAKQPPVCPRCGAAQVRRKVSAAGFVLKGSGWYLTDYARKGKRESNGGKARSKSSSSSAGDGSDSSSPASRASSKEAA